MVQTTIQAGEKVVIAEVNNEFFICQEMTDYETPKQMFANNGDEIVSFKLKHGITDNLQILGLDQSKSISDENGKFYEAIVFCTVVLAQPILQENA